MGIAQSVAEAWETGNVFPDGHQFACLEKILDAQKANINSAYMESSLS
jgi:hypothetical protein